MEPLNDPELNALLRKWQAPNAPAGMQMPGPRASRSVWRWLWSGRIQIPVPIGVVFIVIAALLWLRPVHVSAPEEPAVAPKLENVTTQPVVPAAAPAAPVSPTPVDVTPVATARSESASLSGFRPVQELQPKIIQVRP